MLFNPCHSKDFLPQLEADDQIIELVEQTKLLGLVIRSSNTDYMVSRCNSKLWVIRRLKKLGASDVDLLDV